MDVTKISSGHEGMPHAFSLSTLDETHPTGRTLLDRVGAWVRA